MGVDTVSRWLKPFRKVYSSILTGTAVATDEKTVDVTREDDGRKASHTLSQFSTCQSRFTIRFFHPVSRILVEDDA